MDADGGLAARLTAPNLPPSFDRWQVVVPPGTARPTSAAEWAGCLVLVEDGNIEVECLAGGHRSFSAGDLLALGWLPLRTIRNVGDGEARLLAVRRHGRLPAEPFLHVQRVRRAKPPKGPAPMTSATFRTTIELGGKTATGFRVPEDAMERLGAGRRPAVVVRMAGHSYRSTVGSVDGIPTVPVSAEQRAAAGVSAGDEVEVTLELDTAPREIDVPADLAAALDAEPAARRTFDGLSNSNKRFHVDSVAGAKTDETRQRRIAKSVAVLREGRPR